MDEPLPLDTGTTAAGGVPLAAIDPVARVLIDHAVPHLARAFDYAVPEKFAQTALPGVRVRVRFAGKLRDGYLLSRAESSDHVGALAVIERITSPVQVLGPEQELLCRAVAERYAGTLPDVLRLAIPPRHARAEKAVLAGRNVATDSTAPSHTTPTGSAAADSENAAATDAVRALASWFVDMVHVRPGIGPHLQDSTPPAHEHAAASSADREAQPTSTEASSVAEAGPPIRATASVVPGTSAGLEWVALGLETMLPVLVAGKSVLWLVPDHRQLAVLSAVVEELAQRVGESALGAALAERAVLNADQDPAGRWTAWLRGLLGKTRLLIGTRAAAFAPLTDLGLIVVTDDSDSNYLDQHAPYPHAREVALVRAEQQACGILLLSGDRSPEVQRLVDIGYLRDIGVDATARRAGSPYVHVPDEERDPFAWQRIPSRAWDLMTRALRPKEGVPGPVLVQVPRAGYFPVFACARCQELARCPQCENNLSTVGESGPFACRNCGYHSDTFRCTRCHGTQVRSIVRGRGRTVEELRRALPGVEILESGGDDIPIALDAAPRVVVATTGAEPYVAGGYAAAVLLDSLWPGPGLRAPEEGIARRLRAASLVRSRTDGGNVYLGERDEVIRAALTTFDPVTAMARQLAERRELGFPPYRRIVELRGSATAIDEVLGEVPQLSELIREDAEATDPDRVLQRSVAAFRIADGPVVGPALAALTAARSAKKQAIVHIRIDAPHSL